MGARRIATLAVTVTVTVLALALPGCKKRGPKAPDSAGTGIDPDATAELVVQAGSNHLITDVEFSPDGRWLASTSADGLLKVFDVRMGKEWRTYAGSAGPLYKVTWSPDQNRIAAAGLDKSIHVWDVASGTEIAVLPGHSGWVWDVEFSPDGRSLASGAGVQDTMAVIWDVETKAIRHALQHEGGIGDIAWSKDGKMLVTASKFVDVWNAETGGRLGTIEVEPNGEGSRSLYFSPDGSLLAINGSKEQVHVYDANTWGPVRTIEGASLVGWNPADGELFALQGDTLARFDARTGQRAGAWPSRAGIAGRDAAFSPDGGLLASFDEMNLHVFDVATSTRVRTIESTFWRHVGAPLGNDTELLHVAWSPNAPVIATAGFDGMLRVLDLRRGVAPKAVAAGPHIERDSGPTILGWAPPKVGLIDGLGFSPDGKSVLTLDGDGVAQWDAQTLAQKRRFAAPGATAFAFSPDAKVLAVAHENAVVTLFDTGTGQALRASKGGSLDADCQKGPMNTISAYNPISGLGWSSDGKRLFVVYRETATFVEFDAQTLETGKGGCAHRTRVNAVAWARDGSKVAVGAGLHMLSALGGEQGWSDNSVNVYSLDGEMAMLHRFEGHALAVLDASFSPDGKTLATSSVDRTARLWDVESGAAVATLSGHGAEVDSVTFSHDGRFLATASYDLSVKVWDLASREEVATIVTLGPDGFVIETSDNYYTASRQGLQSVAFRIGGVVVPVELYDLRLNRPDLVLRRFGYAAPDLVKLYEKVYRKRLAKMGLDEKALRPDYHLPTVAITNQVPVTTAGREAQLEIVAEDAQFRLDRLLVHVNDVPIHGSAGIDLGGRTNRDQRTLALDLLPGRNKIQVSVLNRAGTESLKDTVEIVSTAPATKPNLYVVTVGVSQYADSRMDLKYAAKDARDVAALFRAQGGRFGKVEVIEVVDDQATREKILAARKKLEKTRIEDQVVVFVAGHGMLDKELDYWFVTHDFDRKRPARRGLSYEQLEGLLDGIPARRKLLMIDTCHSGEVDEDAIAKAVPPPGAKGAGRGVENVKVATSFRSFSYQSGIENVDQSHELLAQLFADLRRGSGAMVVSSAAGAEFALESPRWKNGVFTYSVLHGLSSGEADRDGDHTIRVSELRDYVVHEVQRLTQGAQTPTSRRENLEFDFPVF